jgi:hypothetical protein
MFITSMQSRTNKTIPVSTNPATKANREDVAALAAAGGDCGCGEGGSDGDKVEAFGTVTAVLQFGHGAVTPIWAGVAEMC